MTGLTSLLASPRPTVGIEFAADHVTAVRLEASGPPAAVTGYATEPLRPGVLVPALNAANVTDMGEVASALRRALERAGVRSGHAALVVPDPVAKVSLLRFDQVPPRSADLAELIRWQVKKSVPFAIEDAQLTYMPGAVLEAGREFVVALARRDIVQEYERAGQAAGLQPGIVDLATFNLVNATLAAGAPPERDWLLVHVAADYLTLAILRGDRLIFFRHRGAEDGTTLADVVHQTAMYYEDRLQGRGFARVVLAGAGRVAADDSGSGSGIAALEGIRRELEQRLQSRVEPIDPRPGITLTDRVSASAALLDTLAPAVGLLLRDRVA
jgi:type IV pilus assembly protein PilM